MGSRSKSTARSCQPTRRALATTTDRCDTCICCRLDPSPAWRRLGRPRRPEWQRGHWHPSRLGSVRRSHSTAASWSQPSSLGPRLRDVGARASDRVRSSRLARWRSAEQDPVLEPFALFFQAGERGAKPSDTLLLFSATLSDRIGLSHIARPGLAPPPAKQPELAVE
jgi:hypothetical protein